MAQIARISLARPPEDNQSCGENCKRQNPEVRRDQLWRGVAVDSLSDLITVSAKPGSVSFDPSRSAVIVVDMQNDFGSEGGMFALGGIDISGIRSVIPTIARVVAAARRA